jgi:type I restriction enzyme, S subunit
MTENNNIPKHWKLKKLGHVCGIVYGKGLPVKELKAIGYPVFGANGIIGFNDKYLFEEPQVLISCRGAASGKINLSPAKCYVTNNSLILDIKEKKELDRNYLYYALSIAKKTKLVTGTAQPQVTINNAVELDIAFPPLPEQQAIVSKIEELLSDLENGKQQLQTAQQQLKVYRQSLLKWAFEGKFTNQNVKDGELPEGWKVKNLGTVLNNIEAGKSFKCDERTPNLDEIGVLKVSAVTWQIFNEFESKTVIDKGRINKYYFVKQDDFLFSRANTLDLIGAVVIVNSIERNLMLSDKTLRFRFNSDVLPKYILFYLRSRKGRKEIQRLSTGNQESMRNIGQARIKQIEFPFCTKEEQQLVVNELESKLTVCDKVEEINSQSLQQAETLKQSILKKAFEGKLVKNHGSDNIN